ncbi:hypothetical protein D9619_002929 [Psilocybe cf. subviscida]|uniref:PLC-like phosphodiesterase n=1 Tax=Psilocybe cf. subviscida TaxID=2480587 RepID=A0A8H5AWL7_9AGAR|nr:hypothetical protein D9619_002929 [Psilocybe cf. subviscida]
MFRRHYATVLTFFAAASVMMGSVGASPSGLALAPQDNQRRATVCNGHAELCSRSFGNVTFVGAHDSYAIGNSLTTNQDQSITTQLDDGIRMLQMQAHNESGVIRLCHTSCSLYDGGTLEDYLKLVLSLLIVNIDNMPASSFGAVFQSVGLDSVSFKPQTPSLPRTAWPTLGELIDGNTRLLTFLDNGADTTQVPYLIDEFTNIWETAFNVIDPNFDCNVNRTKASDPSTQMFLINHFLDKILVGVPVPATDKLNVTNAVSGFGSLGAQVDTCVTTQGRPPNFMLVDFYEYGGGSVFQVAAQINGVQYNPSKPIANPSSTATGAAGSVSVTSSSLNGGLNTVATSLVSQLFALCITLLFVGTGTLTVL